MLFSKSVARSHGIIIGILSIVVVASGCVGSTSETTPPPSSQFDSTASDGSDVATEDSIPETAQDIAVDTTPVKKNILVLLQTSNSFDPFMPGDVNIRIADIKTGFTLRNFELGKRRISDFVVDYQKGLLYLAEPNDNKITVLSLTDGSFVRNMSFKGVLGLALSKNGKKLYAIGYEGGSSGNPASTFKLFDAETGLLTGSLLGQAGDQANGLVISEDEKLAAYVTFDGSKPFLRTIDLVSFQQLARTAITTTTVGCTATVSKIAFGDSGRIILRDGNCDAIYQYDLASKTLLSSLQINFPNKDSGSAMNPVLAYSSTAGIGIATKEDTDPSAPNYQSGLYSFNPATLDYKLVPSLIGMNSGHPSASVMSSDKSKLFISWNMSNSGSAPQEIHVLKLTTGTWETGSIFTTTLGDTRNVQFISLGQE